MEYFKELLFMPVIHIMITVLETQTKTKQKYLLIHFILPLNALYINE